MTALAGRRRRAVGVALLLGAGAVAFISGAGATGVARWATSKAEPPAPRVDIRTVTNLRVALSTVTTPVPSGLVSWTTTWTLCWDPLPGAIAYDIQAMTSESASARLRRSVSPCFMVDVAAGEDLETEVAAKRDTQVAMQRAQIAYRVRADLGSNVVSTWSPAIDAGATSNRPR